MNDLDLICNTIELSDRTYSTRDFQEFLSGKPEQKPIHLGFTLEQEQFDHFGFIPALHLRPKKDSGTNRFDELLLYCRDTFRNLTRFDFSFKDTTKPLRHQRIINPTLRSLEEIGVFAPLITIPSIGIFYLRLHETIGSFFVGSPFDYMIAIGYLLFALGGCYTQCQEEKYRNRHNLIAYQKYKTFCDNNPLRTR